MKSEPYVKGLGYIFLGFTDGEWTEEIIFVPLRNWTLGVKVEKNTVPGSKYL